MESLIPQNKEDVYLTLRQTQGTFHSEKLFSPYYGEEPPFGMFNGM